MTEPRVLKQYGQKLSIFEDYILWCHPGHTSGKPACGEDYDHCERTFWFDNHAVHSKDPLTVMGLCYSCPPCNEHLYVVKDVLFPVITKNKEIGVLWNEYHAARQEYEAERRVAVVRRAKVR